MDITEENNHNVFTFHFRDGHPSLPKVCLLYQSRDGKEEADLNLPVDLSYLLQFNMEF